MKLVRDLTGRFNKRPHYSPTELDQECERLITAFLKRHRGKIEFPISTGDLCVLIEQQAEDLDLYADLTPYGEGVEGATFFVPSGRPTVRISSLLSGDDKRENRLRTTLTHEFGHVHFHAYLFDRSMAVGDLFLEAPDAKPLDNIQICNRDTIIDARQSDWMEWQAGHVCGAILMPAQATKRLVQDAFGSEIGVVLPTVADELGIRIARAVATSFQVSDQAARVRLMRLGVLLEAGLTPSLITPP